MKRENAGNWISRLEKEQILETYSAQLQKSWKFMENYFGIYKKYWRRNTRGGPTRWQQAWGASPIPLGAPLGLVGPVAGLWCPSSAIWRVFTWKKFIRKLSGRCAAVSRQNLGRSNLGLQQSCSAGETSLLEGEIEAIVITNDLLIERGSISINIFTSTISSQFLVHLLLPIFVSIRQIGTCGVLVVLITLCSWC